MSCMTFSKLPHPRCLSVPFCATGINASTSVSHYEDSMAMQAKTLDSDLESTWYNIIINKEPNHNTSSTHIPFLQIRN